MSSRDSSRSRKAHIDTLDFDSHRKPASTNDGSRASSPHGLLRDDESLLSNVVDGIIERDRRKMKRQVVMYLSFASAVFSWYYSSSRCWRRLNLTCCLYLVSALDPLQSTRSTDTSSNPVSNTLSSRSTKSPLPLNSACTSPSQSLAIYATDIIHDPSLYFPRFSSALVIC